MKTIPVLTIAWLWIFVYALINQYQVEIHLKIIVDISTLIIASTFDTSGHHKPHCTSWCDGIEGAHFPMTIPERAHGNSVQCKEKELNIPNFSTIILLSLKHQYNNIYTQQKMQRFIQPYTCAEVVIDIQLMEHWQCAYVISNVTAAHNYCIEYWFLVLRVSQVNLFSVRSL